MGTLTVRENLAFSAALRLPTTISNQEKRERVDEIINELGLNECKDTKVCTTCVGVKNILVVRKCLAFPHNTLLKVRRHNS